jgi:hypothetical protein
MAASRSASRSTIRTALGVLVVTIVLGLVAAELGVRVFQPVPPAALLPFVEAPLPDVQAGAPESYGRFDAELGWSQGRSARTVDDGIVFQSGAGGFRADREYDLAPPRGVRRIEAFGDSFVHCDKVNYEDCWTKRLEQSWAGAEVLNFGIPGGSPDQGWLRYQRDGRAYEPCAVLIGFQVENINRVVNRYRPFYAPHSGIALSKPRFVLDGEGLRLLPNPLTSPATLNDPAWVEANLGPGDFWYFRGMLAPQPLDDLILARLVRTALYRQRRSAIEEKVDDAHPNGHAYSPDDERFQVAGRVLVQFARDVEASGATPVVVIFGQKGEVTSTRHRLPKEYQPLLDWLKAERIATLDSTDDLAREADRSGVDGLFARGGHYSRRGNEAVGRGLASRLPRLVGSSCP